MTLQEILTAERPANGRCCCGKVTEPQRHPLSGLYLPTALLCWECGEAQRKEEAAIAELEKQAVKKRLRAAGIDGVLERSGVPPEYHAMTLDNLKPHAGINAALAAVRDMMDTREGMIFIGGTVGTGKTHLAVAAVREYLLQLRSAYFTSSSNLLATIRASFNSEERGRTDRIIRYYSTVNLLALDDVGVEKPTEWVRPTLYNIIDNRYTQKKATIITSNLTVEAVSERMGGDGGEMRLASRLAHHNLIFNTGGDDWRDTHPKRGNDA